MEFIKLFLPSFVGAIVLDMIWFGALAKRFYMDNLSGLLSTSGGQLAPNWPAVMLVYVAIVSGILFFVLPKANGGYSAALMWGAVFGAVLYGTYNFTNYAVLVDWPLKVALVDFVWGIVLCASVSVFATYLLHLFNGTG